MEDEDLIQNSYKEIFKSRLIFKNQTSYQFSNQLTNHSRNQFTNQITKHFKNHFGNKFPEQFSNIK